MQKVDICLSINKPGEYGWNKLRSVGGLQLNKILQPFYFFSPKTFFASIYLYLSLSVYLYTRFLTAGQRVESRFSHACF